VVSEVHRVREQRDSRVVEAFANIFEMLSRRGKPPLPQLFARALRFGAPPTWKNRFDVRREELNLTNAAIRQRPDHYVHSVRRARCPGQIAKTVCDGAQPHAFY